MMSKTLFKVGFLIKMAYVEREGGKWYVFSHKGKKLSRGYDTREEAIKRLRQIEYFKHHKGE